MLSSCTPCVPIRTFLFYTLVISVSLSPIFERPSPQPFPTRSLGDIVILEFRVSPQTSHTTLSFFWFYFYHFKLMRGTVWYHLPSIEIINTVRETGQVDHITRQSPGSCGIPSAPSATPGGSSPIISAGGAPCSCIYSARTQHCHPLDCSLEGN